jgi:hypothetical protein
MSEGLKWLLELDGKTEGIDKMLSTIEDTIASLPKATAATKDLNASIEKSSSAGEKAAAGHKKHKAGIEETEGALKRLVNAGIGPFIEKAKQIAEFEFIRRGVDKIIEAPGELIDKVKELGEEAIKAAAGAERMDLSFKLTIGQEGAEKVLGWIDRIASKTEFTDDQLKGWANELLVAGVKAGEVDKFLAAGLDVAAKSPDKLAGMGNAIAALTRAQLTGRVEGRALRGLRIGVDELRTLPEFKGLSAKALHEKMEQGSISKNDLLRLIAGPDKQLGDLGLKAGDTLQAKLKNLETLPEQYFQRLAESPAFENLKAKLGDVFDALDPASPRGQKIFGSLERMFTTVVDEVAKIDFVSVADTLEHRVLPAIEKLFGFAAKTADVLGTIVTGAGSALGSAHAVTSMAGVTTKTAEDTSFMKRVLSHLPGVGSLGKSIGYLDKDTQKAGAAIAEGTADGMAGGMSMVSDAASSMGDAAVDALQSKLEIHSPSKVFFGLGEETGAGFAGGVRKSGSDVDDAMEAAFPVPGLRPGASIGGGGGSSISVSLPSIQVNMHGGSGDAREDGEAAGEGLGGVFRRELLRVMEQLQIEGGA